MCKSLNSIYCYIFMCINVLILHNYTGNVYNMSDNFVFGHIVYIFGTIMEYRHIIELVKLNYLYK